MDKKIFEDIIGALEKSAKPSRFARFSDKRYKPVLLDKKNFHSIQPESSDKRIAFVDGSNVEIFGANNFSLQLVRTYSTVYSSNKRVSATRNQFFAFCTAANEADELRYRVQTFPDALDKLEVDSFDSTLRTGQEQLAIARVGDLVRSLAELKVAKNEICDVVVRDGILQPKLTFEADYYKELFGRTTALAGLAKTTDLFTDSGDSLVAVLKRMAPEASWYYWPLVENNNPEHPVEICVVKLHPKSKYLFRFELSKQHSSQMQEILGALAQNSKDPTFLGYPYGLVEAHNFAKITFKEKIQLKTVFQGRAGSRWKHIESYLRGSDAHDILDSL